MGTPENHEIHSFMAQVSDEIAAEYSRIRARANEDPGTAGDEGESNWAELLREWLPTSYSVVTKGRIVGESGSASPQLDVLVLKSTYPKKLLSKKVYLAAGVAAAFECKNTLKAKHISIATETCRKLKSLYKPRTGTPYKELCSPIVYGILAHSHSWKGENSKPLECVGNQLFESDLHHIAHPREMLDIVCVADLGTWCSMIGTFFGPNQLSDWSRYAELYGPDGSAISGFVEHSTDAHKQKAHYRPISTLISMLAHRLAWENPDYRDMADHYRELGMWGNGQGKMRTWSSEIYSPGIRNRIERGELALGLHWDEWGNAFP